jgi:CRP/FNR family transcriptional regulator, cyclic AMP receptor protein
MTQTSVLGAFGGHVFLSGLSERHLMLLASGVKPMRFAPGEYLAREGQSANAFYLIQTGYVALELHTPDRGVVPVQTVGEGQALGWSWIVPPHRWRFDCRAVDHVEALAFNAEWLRDRCEQDHELGYQLLKHLVGVVASRLSATRLQLLDLHR